MLDCVMAAAKQPRVNGSEGAETPKAEAKELQFYHHSTAINPKRKHALG